MDIRVPKNILDDAIDQIGSMAEYIGTKPRVLDELISIRNGAKEPAAQADACECPPRYQSALTGRCDLCGE